MKKQFAVFGLGSFGRSVALTLENLGCDVVVVDKSYEKIQEISDMVSYAMRADVSDPDALHALGGRNLDGAVVAVSESLEASIMATISPKRWESRMCSQRRKMSCRAQSSKRWGQMPLPIQSAIWGNGWQKA